MVLIQEKIHDYRQKLDDIRDRIIRVSPDKWVDDEIEDSDCSGEFDFDEGDITPAKGSVSKIEKKRLIFDMLRDLNSILQSKLKIGSLKKSQIIGIQKIHEGNKVLISQPSETGKGLIWTILKASKKQEFRIKGIILVFTTKKRIHKRTEILEKLNIPYSINYDNDKSDESMMHEKKHPEIILCTDDSDYFTLLDSVEKLQIGLIVFDGCLSSSNISDYAPIITRFHQVPLLVTGLYTKQIANNIARVFDIPQRYLFSNEPSLKDRLKNFTISKDSDKVKALLSFVKQHVDGLERDAELSFVKDDAFRNILPIVILCDSKKERDRLTEGFFSISLKVTHIGDSNSEADDKMVYIGNTSRILEVSRIKHNFLFILGFPKQIDHLLGLFNFNGEKQHLFFTDKEFASRRSSLLMDFIEPANLLKLLKSLKKASNNSVLKLINSASKKSEFEEKYLRVRESELLQALNISKREEAGWLVSKLMERNKFSVAYSLPARLKVSITIPSEKNRDPEGLLKEIIDNGKLVSGRYNIEILTFCGSLMDGEKKILESTKSLVKKETISDLQQEITRVLELFSSLKKQGKINFEFTDHFLFFEVQEDMSDVEMYQIISERKLHETESINQFDLMYSVLNTNSLGVLEQLAKGITRTQKTIELGSYTDTIYTQKKDAKEIYPNYRKDLKIKTELNQRERNTIVQDFRDVISKETQKIKPLMNTLGGVPEDIKKRSVILFLLKQVYGSLGLAKKKNSLKSMKTNESTFKKYADMDFLAVYNVLFEGFKNLKLEK